VYAIILAGGGGTRLWPLSRPERPKPFHALTGERTLLQGTWDRMVPDLLGPDDVFVVTAARYGDLVREQLPTLPADNIILEPVGRNTAAAIALATMAIDRPDDEVMVVLPADHLVQDEAGFRTVLTEAAALAATPDRLVTLGIAPTGPETGYGYIVADHALAGHPDAAAVARFVEKPSSAAATALLAGGALVAWNAGIFAWRRDTIRHALETSAPDVLDAVRSGASGGWPTLQAAYERVRDISVDYAVMEPAAAAGRVVMRRISVGWSDLGSWSALRDALADASLAAGTASGTVGRGPRRDIDSERTLVLADGRLVVTIGLRDLVIVDTPDALLVAAAERSQDVKIVAAEAARNPNPRPRLPG
jgi:mannose-1-phosphate guanylyltransferase/mannose-6-phosphate isomerase